MTLSRPDALALMHEQPGTFEDRRAALADARLEEILGAADERVRYLSEFLSDPRVIETPPLIWQPILQGIARSDGRLLAPL